uniref:polycystin-1-like protein 1 n=1 Tax=Pristiophorus japonicus TaxID=55135 RepID=UPI00398E4760
MMEENPQLGKKDILKALVWKAVSSEQMWRRHWEKEMEPNRRDSVAPAPAAVCTLCQAPRDQQGAGELRVAKWNAKLASGSNYIFLWLYTDGIMNHTIIGPNQLVMAINSTGLISVEVVAQNEVSHARASMTTVAQGNLMSTINYQAHAGGNYYVKVIISSPLYSSPFSRLLPGLVKVRTPIIGLQALFPFSTNSAKLLLQPDGSYATQILGFSVHTFAEEVKFLFDFGDGSPLLTVSGMQSSFDGTFASGRHRFTKEGVFYITVSTFNEFYNATNELGAYFVQMVAEGLVLTMNSSVIHKNEVILFSAMLTKGTNVIYSWNMGDQTSYVDEGPVIKHKFLSAGIYNVTVNARNKVGMVSTYVTVAVLYRMQPVSITTNKTIYATYSDIVFTAITTEDDPLQFVWYFGDKLPMKTTSRSITTSYSTPGRYNVIVNASNQISSFTSNIYPVELQQIVEPNRLRMNNQDLTSVLLNSSVAVEVHINDGTNLSYLWSFGDGTMMIGNRQEYHSYDREGEFTVKVVIFNNVSSASLSGQLFVISENCQPPPVKSYGPSKIEIRRYQSFKLGVTFESEFVCNISRGIQYSWSFFEQDRSLVTLSQVDVSKQFILIPGYLLDYGIYLAIARVQIVGSVVYNNYTVSVEILATPPVSVISGGTQLFIAYKHESIISLNGSESFDPDYPGTANLRIRGVIVNMVGLSGQAKVKRAFHCSNKALIYELLIFSWSCESVSGLNVPCFKPDASDPLNTTSSTVSVSMSTLKTDIDQFLFKLTVNNNNRNSSAAQLFLTVKKEDNLRLVKLFCAECLNNSVNWNDAFSVKAVCEECSETVNLSYSWKLYLVNSTETEPVEVPFCKLVVDNLQSSILGPIVTDAAPKPGVTSSIRTLFLKSRFPVGDLEQDFNELLSQQILHSLMLQVKGILDHEEHVIGVSREDDLYAQPLQSQSRQPFLQEKSDPGDKMRPELKSVQSLEKILVIHPVECLLLIQEKKGNRQTSPLGLVDQALDQMDIVVDSPARDYVDLVGVDHVVQHGAKATDMALAKMFSRLLKCQYADPSKLRAHQMVVRVQHRPHGSRRNAGDVTPGIYTSSRFWTFLFQIFTNSKDPTRSLNFSITARLSTVSNSTNVNISGSVFGQGSSNTTENSTDSADDQTQAQQPSRDPSMSGHRLAEEEEEDTDESTLVQHPMTPCSTTGPRTDATSGEMLESSAQGARATMHDDLRHPNSQNSVPKQLAYAMFLSRLQRKISTNQAERRWTGGGPADLHIMTDLEERAAALVQREAPGTSPLSLQIVLTTGEEQEQDTTEEEDDEPERVPVVPAATSPSTDEVMGPSLQQGTPSRPVPMLTSWSQPDPPGSTVEGAEAVRKSRTCGQREDESIRALNRRPYLSRIFREHFYYLQLSEEQCIRRLSFIKEMAAEPCHLLQPDFEPQIRVPMALPVAVKVTVALNFFTSRFFQSATGDIANILQFAVYGCIRQVTDALYRRRRGYISFPITREKQDERCSYECWPCGSRAVGRLLSDRTSNFRWSCRTSSASSEPGRPGYRLYHLRMVGSSLGWLDIEQQQGQWQSGSGGSRNSVILREDSIKSQTITFKPFGLKSKKIYMIEVIVGGQSQTGKAQLFLFSNEAPQGLTCEVRPSIGSEIQTHYSMFCTSGRKDLHYEYSYRIGNSTETVLYDGRDHEYYFTLPAGEATDGYKLTINTVITDLFGSKTKPCPVTPIVSPSIKTDEELYTQGLQKLSTLILLGNQKETKNYILLLARVLHRLHKEGSSKRHLQKQTRNALIKALCSLTISNQVTSETALIVTGTVKEMIKLFKESGEFRMHEELVKKIVYVVADVMGVTDNSTVKSKNLLFEGLKATTELLLRYVLINNQSQFYVNTNLMELQTTQNYGFQNTVQSTNSAKFYLPDLLDKQIAARTGGSCIISHLISFKQNPYPWGTSPVEINGDVADLTLYNCTNRRKVEVKGLKIPVLIEFERKNRIQEQFSAYLLLRTQMNIHILRVTPANLQQALQIRVNFTRPIQQMFPIMLLVRSNKEPTPSKYNLKQIHYWDGDTIHLFIPAASLLGVGTYYLGLLDANYNRKPKNNYLAKNVSYTLSIQWTQCLYWDDIREWKSDGCSPQQGSDSQKINCSCNHMTTFTVAHQQVGMKDVKFTDVLTFISAFENYATCITVLFALTLYILLVILCKRMDFYIETKPGLVVLQDNAPTDQHLYEITVETGFRTRAGTTAKVHIKLHGEDGVSETRELYHSEKQLFERNSRHTFIMSVPESLGSIWKVHLWHNNGGHSPSWYITSVIVKDLLNGTCWFFPAECWLAVDEGDGKVERELNSLTHGPGFKKLLYSKLTEYLEDFHLWGSVYSRPSYSSFTHTQRLSVCLCLLLGYMCLNAVLTDLKDEEYTAELGLIDVSTVSLVTGLITTIVVLPVVLLVSLLFRFSKVKLLRETSVEEHYGTTRESNVYSVEAHRDALLASDSAFESYLSWQNLQQWAQEAWRKKYERGLLESQAPSIHSEHNSETSNKKGGHCSSEGSSSGFEDCSSQENVKAVPKDSKHSSSDLRSDYSSACVTGSNLKTTTSEVLLFILFARKIFLQDLIPLSTYVVGTDMDHDLWLFILSPQNALQLLGFPTYRCWQGCTTRFYLAVFVARCTDRERAETRTLCAGGVYIPLKSGLFVVQHQKTRLLAVRRTRILREKRRLKKVCVAVPESAIVAARQRARYLRLARPPTPAQLKEAKDRMRKESLIQQTLQEFVLYIVMLILLLLIIFGKFSKDEYYLNQAIRVEFTRGFVLKQESLEEKSIKNCKSLSKAKRAYSMIEKEALSCIYGVKTMHQYLFGLKFELETDHKPLISLFSESKGINTNASACIQRWTLTLLVYSYIPEVLSGLIRDCGPPYTTMIHHPDHSNSIKNERTAQSSQCGRFNCYKGRGSIINLGRTRHEAYTKLLKLKEIEWIDRNTRAVIVEFTLYNPPTNLFTTVSLLAELPPLGGVLPSAQIESVSIYQKKTLLDYFIMAFELLFLALILLHLYFQVCRMTQRGILSYWQEPWNWLEVRNLLQ